MLGFYDYTVILTYLSAISAGLGIIVSLHGEGHPFWGVFFLMCCGLFDAFDGKVARTKKNRSESAIKFGIQIDSLTDVVAFGVLPGCIGTAMIRICPNIPEVPRIRSGNPIESSVVILLFTIILLYILAALIRLAYFNVEEEERQKKEEGGRKYYTGVPVTSAAIVFPSILLLQFVLPIDITIAYFVVMLLLGLAFVSRIQIPKPGLRGILIMVGMGIVEFILLLCKWNIIYGL